MRVGAFFLVSRGMSADDRRPAGQGGKLGLPIMESWIEAAHLWVLRFGGNPRSPRCKPGGYFCVCERLFLRGKEAKLQSQKHDDNEAFAELPSDPLV